MTTCRMTPDRELLGAAVGGAAVIFVLLISISITRLCEPAMLVCTCVEPEEVRVRDPGSICSVCEAYQ